MRQIRSDIPDDSSLILRMCEGDTAALGILIEKHREYVARIASRFLLRDEEICEVVQDAFIRVWKHAGEYDRRNRFTTWIYTITFNLCLDRLKAVKRRNAWMVPGHAPDEYDPPSEQADAAGGIDREVIAGAIREYATELGEVQRTVFMLRDLQDLQVEEVCEVTGFDAVKVKTNLYHARKYVRERLIQGGYL